tara:strand:- start:16447 stop:17154 length:708 start_codon:yes stop_codon:yes gene_type:complete
MDFQKFSNLIETGGLYFARADKLGDEYEGSMPVNQRFEEEHAEPNFQDKDGNPIEMPVEVKEQFSRVPKYLNPSVRRMNVKSTFVSCWHSAQDENAGMWGRYTKTNESVCIKSRYNILRQLLPHEAHIGRVQYIDFDKDLFPSKDFLEPFVHKRRFFEDEREIRAVIPFSNARKCKRWKSGEGYCVPVDLNKMIETIYLHPRSSETFVNMVEELVGDKGLEALILKSRMGKPPIH